MSTRASAHICSRPAASLVASALLVVIIAGVFGQIGLVEGSTTEKPRLEPELPLSVVNFNWVYVSYPVIIGSFLLVVGLVSVRK